MDRVNVVGDPYTHAFTRQAKIKAYLNPAAFSTPAFLLPTDNPYGNEQRNQFIGPRNVNTNLSLFKEFPIFRETRFQFRAESFNLFGNVNLLTPRTNYSVFRSLTGRRLRSLRQAIHGGYSLPSRSFSNIESWSAVCAAQRPIFATVIARLFTLFLRN